MKNSSLKIVLFIALAFSSASAMADWGGHRGDGGHYPGPVPVPGPGRANPPPVPVPNPPPQAVQQDFSQYLNQVFVNNGVLSATRSLYLDRLNPYIYGRAAVQNIAINAHGYNGDSTAVLYINGVASSNPVLVLGTNYGSTQYSFYLNGYVGINSNIEIRFYGNTVVVDTIYAHLAL